MVKKELFRSLRSILRVYNKTGEPIRVRFGLTEAELAVLDFIGTNPKLDTARDITEYRLMPKANVSLAVDSLVEKGLLAREQDEADRRRIHLRLTELGESLVPAIRSRRQEFNDVIFGGFTQRQREEYAKLSEKILNNARKYLEDPEEE